MSKKKMKLKFCAWYFGGRGRIGYQAHATSKKGPPARRKKRK
jgi:hypothetical protein